MTNNLTIIDPDNIPLHFEPKSIERAVKWLRLCDFYAELWSKDPSTKVGACIVRPNKTFVSFGYNGFPPGVKDTPERLNDRAEKYPRTVHAEMNAILTATEKLDGFTLYCSLAPCAACAGPIIRAGISSVIAWDTNIDRWWDSNKIGFEMFDEANVRIYLIKKP